MYLLVLIPFYRFNFLRYIEEKCKFLEKVKKRVSTFLYLIFFKKLKSSKNAPIKLYSIFASKIYSIFARKMYSISGNLILFYFIF